MQLFTISLFPIINAVSPIPSGMVTPGIDAQPHPNREVQQLRLGNPLNGCIKFVDAAFIGGAKAKDGKFFVAGLELSRVDKNHEKWFLTQQSEVSDNILVRIIGKTQRDLGLVIGGYTAGVKPIAVGNGYEQSGNEWSDALVVIPPHAAVFINKNGKDAFAIVNTGGDCESNNIKPMPAVITYEEYQRNFVAHGKVTDGPLPPKVVRDFPVGVSTFKLPAVRPGKPYHNSPSKKKANKQVKPTIRELVAA